MAGIEDLRTERHHLFEQCVMVDTSDALLSVQESIANAIRKCERNLASTQDKDALQFHIKKLRLYLDGFVWAILHPHTIRELADARVKAPSLEGQGEAFDRVLRAARVFLEKYEVPIFVTDITNVLRTGDLVICTNREVPLIVEVKTRLPKSKHLLQGRVGRQLGRTKGSLEYLTKGRGKVFGEDNYKQAIESSHIAQRTWEAVTEICQAGRLNGYAFRQLSDYHLLWAYTPDNADSFNNDIKRYKDWTAFAGTSFGLMNMADKGLFPPPSAWPIPTDLIYSLIEEEIIIAHLVDVRALEHEFETGESVKIYPRRPFPVSVSIGQNMYLLSRRFIYDVLYGFETVGSFTKGVVDFAHQIDSGALGQMPITPSGKPVLHHVESLQEARQLLQSRPNEKNALVSMPEALIEQIENTYTPSGDDRIPSVQPTTHGFFQAYAIIDIQTLRELLEGDSTRQQERD